jgi:hypothetical protein
MPFSFHPHGPAAKSLGPILSRWGHPYLIDTWLFWMAPVAVPIVGAAVDPARCRRRSALPSLERNNARPRSRGSPKPPNQAVHGNRRWRAKSPGHKSPGPSILD